MKHLSLVLLFVGSLAHAVVGDLVGYEEMQSRLSARLFTNAPYCTADRDTLERFRDLSKKELASLPIDQLMFVIEAGDELAIKPGFVLSGVVGDMKPHRTSLANLLGSRFSATLISLPMASNHIPNTLNVFAWDVILTELANKLGQAACAPGDAPMAITLRDDSLRLTQCRMRQVQVRDAFGEAARTLCRAGNDGGAYRAASDEIYSLVTAFAFPETEYEAWLAEMTSNDTLALPPAQRLAKGLRMLFLSPYFLLKQ